MVNSRTIINSMIWKMFERFSSQIATFIVSIILARILLPSDYGIIAIILVFINIANVIIDGGFNTALIQKKSADKLDFSTIFWFCLLIALLLYGLFFLTAPIIAGFYDKQILCPVLRVLGLGIILNSYISIQYAYISRNLIFRKQFYVNAVALVISGTVGLIMAYSGFGVWSLVFQSLSNSVTCALLLWIVIKWRPTFSFSLGRFRGLFDYGWKIFVTNMIIAIYENIRSMVVGKLYQPDVLAYFDRGKVLPDFTINNVMTSIYAVLLPSFSAEQDNVGRVKQMMQRSIKVSYLFVAPLLIGLYFAAKGIVLVLLTEKWLPMVPFIQIFCIAYLLMPIQNINAISIRSLGYSNITLKLEIIKKILEAIILVVSFMINVYAVAWGIVLYNFVSLFINLYPSERLVDYGIFEQLKDVMPTLFISMIMGMIVYIIGLFSRDILLILLMQILIGASSYYLLCRMFKLDSLNYVLDYFRQVKNERR